MIKYPVASACRRAEKINTGSIYRWISAFCILCIASAVAIVFFRALFLPMHLPDDMVQWCIRAKIIFHTSTVFADEFFEPYRVLYHAHYPVMIPLLESLIFMALGEADDILVKIPFPCLFCSSAGFFLCSAAAICPASPRSAFYGNACGGAGFYTGWQRQSGIGLCRCAAQLFLFYCCCFAAVSGWSPVAGTICSLRCWP